MNPRLYLIGGALLVLLAAFGWYTLHERHIGAAKVTQADTKAVAAQHAKDDAKDQRDAETVREEARDYAKAVSTAVAGAPVVSLCVSAPGPLHPAAQAPARPVDHGGAELRGADAPVPANRSKWDTRTVLQIAHDANAQVIALQDYIRNVCLAK